MRPGVTFINLTFVSNKRYTCNNYFSESVLQIWIFISVPLWYKSCTPNYFDTHFRLNKVQLRNPSRSSGFNIMPYIGYFRGLAQLIFYFYIVPFMEHISGKSVVSIKKLFLPQLIKILWGFLDPGKAFRSLKSLYFLDI